MKCDGLPRLEKFFRSRDGNNASLDKKECPNISNAELSQANDRGGDFNYIRKHRTAPSTSAITQKGPEKLNPQVVQYFLCDASGALLLFVVKPAGIVRSNHEAMFNTRFAYSQLSFSRAHSSWSEFGPPLSPVLPSRFYFVESTLFTVPLLLNTKVF